ncbi:hypothetical protein DFH27DRAFT_613776 [Peziza echinospora]|nr:hypothetical protein DFH27DRAFT_613776 [Peziza echinospora]
MPHHPPSPLELQIEILARVPPQAIFVLRRVSRPPHNPPPSLLSILLTRFHRGNLRGGRPESRGMNPEADECWCWCRERFSKQTVVQVDLDGCAGEEGVWQRPDVGGVVLPAGGVWFCDGKGLLPTGDDEDPEFDDVNPTRCMTNYVKTMYDELPEGYHEEKRSPLTLRCHSLTRLHALTIPRPPQDPRVGGPTEAHTGVLSLRHVARGPPCGLGRYTRQERIVLSSGFLVVNWAEVEEYAFPSGDEDVEGALEKRLESKARYI